MAMLFIDAKEASNPIIFVNDAFLDLTGYTRAQVLGQSFNFLMARAPIPTHWRALSCVCGPLRRRFRNFLSPSGNVAMGPIQA